MNAEDVRGECRFCGAETAGGADVCHNCLDNPVRQEWLLKLKELNKPLTLDELKEIVSSTIKHDETNKVITFLIMLLTYTEEDQTNLSFNAESSTGKSYIPLELAWYFPKEDIIEYGYVSPTAFFHEHGVLIPDPSDTREDVEPEKRRKINYIDLKRKILIFLDQPHDTLLQRLRPLLSHDRKTIVCKITDQRAKVGLRTKTVWIEGYPTVVFCTAKFSMDDQERTRLLMLSPEVSQDKIRDSIFLKIEKESDRKKFNETMNSDPRRVWLRERVQQIKAANIDYVIIPEDLRAQIAERFMEQHKSLIPRHQRDISRLLALIKAHALLNLWQRERVENSLIVNYEDVLEGFRLYLGISRANEFGLPPEVYNIFEALRGEFPEDGLTRKEIHAAYYRVFRRTVGKKRLDEILNILQSVGLLTEEPDPNDKRQKRWYVPQGVFIFEGENDGLEGTETAEKINTPRPQYQQLDKYPSTPVPERTCGSCALFHKPSCVYPSDNFMQLPENAVFALDCRSFTPKCEA
ncbi:MAG: hypothetical protein QXD19_03875 [Candidatus Bathyarchaeia archaeon]